MTKYVVLCIRLGTQQIVIIASFAHGTILYEIVRNSHDILRYLSTTLSPQSSQIKQIISHIFHFPFLPTPATPKTKKPQNSKKPKAHHFPFPFFTHPGDPISKMAERYINMNILQVGSFVCPLILCNIVVSPSTALYRRASTSVAMSGL